MTQRSAGTAVGGCGGVGPEFPEYIWVYLTGWFWGQKKLGFLDDILKNGDTILKELAPWMQRAGASQGRLLGSLVICFAKTGEYPWSYQVQVSWIGMQFTWVMAFSSLTCAPNRRPFRFFFFFVFVFVKYNHFAFCEGSQTLRWIPKGRFQFLPASRIFALGVESLLLTDG